MIRICGTIFQSFEVHEQRARPVATLSGNLSANAYFGTFGFAMKCLLSFGPMRHLHGYSL